MKNVVKSLVEKNGIMGPLKLLVRFVQRVSSYPKWRALTKKENVFLELGSGPKKGNNNWVTVDLFGADISYDLAKGIPLPAESVDKIYTSHMLEHIPYKDLVHFINECYRVLKHGGEFSVCVPDASRYIRAYIDGLRFRPEGDGYKPAIVDTNSLIDQVNYIAYMDQQHKYMFDMENLVNTLKKAPFRKVCLREFDSERDIRSRDFESIYASAFK